MKTKQLASFLTKRNKGKKLSVIGNERENVGHLSDLIFAECAAIKEGQKIVGILGETAVELYKNGQRRAARRKSK